MNWQFQLNPYSVPLLIGVVVLAIAIVYVWRRRADRPARRVFVLMGVAVGVQVGGAAVSLAGVNLETYRFWAQVAYLGIVFVPPLWLLFVLVFLGYKSWLVPRNIALLFVVPVLTLLFVWTSAWHGLYWAGVEPTSVIGGVQVYRFIYGPWLIVHFSYSFSLPLLSILLLLRAYRHADATSAQGALIRRQVGVLLLAVLLPVLANVVSMVGLTPLAGFDLTPFTLLISIALVTWDLYGLGLLNIVPAAHNAVIESLADGVMLLDARQIIIEVNPAVVVLLRVSKDDLLGQPFDMTLARWAELTAEGSGIWQGQDVLAVGQGDDRRYLSMRLSPIKNWRDDITGYAAVLTDITARRAAEEELRKLSRAVEQSASIVIITNTRGGIEYVNPKFTAVTGYTLDEVRGQNPRFLKSGSSNDETYERLWGTITAGGQWQGELHNRKKDGALYWVSATMSPIFDSHGKVTHFISIQEDITARKEAEAAEREQRLLAEALRDTAAVLNSTLELDEVLDRVLDNAERVISGPHDVASIMLVEDNMARIVRYREYVDHGTDRAQKLAVRLPVDDTHSLRAVMQSSESFIIPDSRAYPGWVETASNDWVRSVITVPIRLHDEVIGFLDLNAAQPNAFTRDHALKLQAFADQAAVAIRNAQLFQTVQRYADELLERNRDLDSFGHTIAHDLRAPLHLIAGYANLIEISDPDTVPPDVVQFAGEVVQAANKMSEMIDNLLLMATVRNAGDILADVEMGPVIEAALYRYRRAIDRRGITVEIDPDLPPARGHGPWLEEVFANLISNAIKYIGEDNPAPQIAIRACREGDWVRYDVQDNGIGIAPADQAKLFEAFSRFAQAEASGFGLGLSIVLRIMQKLEGQVGAESTEGQGSTFWIKLPPALTISQPAALSSAD